ncbi:hypothetical protein CLAIMM_14805 [Cladophialophora immunda]|nr:hypothetical protein CLAIMM_14805 [Cladophialophora immunda]
MEKPPFTEWLVHHPWAQPRGRGQGAAKGFTRGHRGWPWFHFTIALALACLEAPATPSPLSVFPLSVPRHQRNFASKPGFDIHALGGTTQLRSGHKLY